jgi:ankyrin repeat protein
VALLISHGADPHARLADELTPLLLALQEGHEDVALALLGPSSDLGATNLRGDTPLVVAAETGQLRVVGALLPADEAQLSKAMLRALVGLERISRPTPRQRGTQGVAIRQHGPALEAEPVERYREIVRLLLAAGADPDLERDASGRTARKLARRLGEEELLELMGDSGALP